LAQEGADKFIAVELPPVATMACCEVVLPNGCRVIVPPGHDANSLRSILAVLGEEASTC
jgi:hypothetical protein